MHSQHQRFNKNNSSQLDPQLRQATQFPWLEALNKNRTLRIKCRLQMASPSHDNNLCPSSTASTQKKKEIKTIAQEMMALQHVEMEQGKVLTATSAFKA